MDADAPAGAAFEVAAAAMILVLGTIYLWK